MSHPALTEKELRIFAKDMPEYNSLINGVRFTSEDIQQAVLNVVDRYNLIMPPLQPATVDSFPSRSLMMMGVWGWLLMGAAIHQASNELDYSADGVSVNDNNKAQIFTALGEKYWTEFKETAQQYKLSVNINSVYRTKSSEYRFRPW